METNAREVCRETIKSLVPPTLWEQNRKFCEELAQQIRGHALLAHPALAVMQSGGFDVTMLTKVHLEFRYTFAQTFTDGLLQAMQLMSQVESRFGSLGKLSTRFLLAFNLLDELGFQPGRVGANGYAGSPRDAHYVKFHDTLLQLGVTESSAAAYVPSDAAVACRRVIEGSYQDLKSLLCVLAVEETVFDKFASPWAQNMQKKTEVDTREGYHSIHVEHDDTSLDSHHAEDLWYVFQTVVEPAHYPALRERTAACLDSVLRFVDNLASGQR